MIFLLIGSSKGAQFELPKIEKSSLSETKVVIFCVTFIMDDP
jgi:hypothetical protein